MKPVTSAAVLLSICSTAFLRANQLSLYDYQPSTREVSESDREAHFQFAPYWPAGCTQLNSGTVNYTVSGPTGRVSPASGTLNVNSTGGRTVIVPFSDNGIPEEDFYISVSLSNPVNLVLLTSGYSITVRDNDRRSITVTGGSITEGHAGTKLLSFTISQGTPLTVPFFFTYTTSGGTAVAGQDYVAASGTATIPAGSASTTVNVTIIGDTQVELDEIVGLALSNLSHPTNGLTSTPGTIVTDDFPPGPAPSPTVVTEASGNSTSQAWFAVDLSAARTVDFSCKVSTRNGTALAGSDYNALAATTITYAAGETRKWGYP